MEMMAAGASKYDLDRFGAGVFRPSARQADVMILAGTISKKMTPVIRQLWEQMPAPKWAIAMGGCTIDGGPFKYPNQYAIEEGADKVVPVDVYIPGCPATPRGPDRGNPPAQREGEGRSEVRPMSQGLHGQLEALATSCEASDYAASGFHFKYKAELDQLVPIAQAGAKAGYILEMMTCEDRREDAGAMRLCYTYNSLTSVDRHLVHIDVPPTSESDASYLAPTLCPIFGGANWFEREVFDMYGVVFEEHPELERILLPEDADFFALRRDFGRIEDAEEEEEEEEETSGD